MVNATLANTINAVGDITPAIVHFREAAKVASKSELYSLGLFQISWGREDGTKRSTKWNDSWQLRNKILAKLPDRSARISHVEDSVGIREGLERIAHG
jgi:hypothetical protein